MSESKTAAQIILETIEYYGTDPEGRRGLKRGTITEYNEDTGEHDKKHSYSCQYVIENGQTKFCAVGRCLTDEAKAHAKDNNGDVGDLIHSWWQKHFARDEYSNRYHSTIGYNCAIDEEPEEREEYYLDDMLAPEYRGHTSRLWQRLQTLHDTNENWSDSPLPGVWLSPRGFHYVMEELLQFIPTQPEIDNLRAELSSRYIIRQGDTNV